MKRKSIARISIAGSSSSALPLTDRLDSSRITEEQGRKFRVETLVGKEFKLPLDSSERVSWRSMPSDIRVEYAVAYCTEHKCWIKHVGHLRDSLTPEEVNKIRTKLKIPTERKETLNGIVFKLPLNNQGNVSWNRIPEKDQVNYSTAFCIHHHCSVVKLPGGLVNIICNNNF